MWCEIVTKLLQLGQAHLFRDWPEPGENDEEIKQFLNKMIAQDCQ